MMKTLELLMVMIITLIVIVMSIMMRVTTATAMITIVFFIKIAELMMIERTITILQPYL